MRYTTQPGWWYDRVADRWTWHDERGSADAWITGEFIHRVDPGMALGAVRQLMGRLGCEAPPPYRAALRRAR